MKQTASTSGGGSFPASAAGGASADDGPDLGRMGFFEFVLLISQITALVAFSIDAMLPTLGAISLDLGLADANDRQAVITYFVLGMSVSPLVFGVMADAIGRRPTLFVGFAIYMLGTLLCVLATDYALLLLGRVLSGLGAAAPRILALTIVRDRFEGRAMARVMSFVMTVFVLIPAFAPAIGLGLSELGGWRAVFGATFAFSVIVAIWAALRLPETLAVENRRPVTVSLVTGGLWTALSDRWVICWGLATGAVFGAFLAFLSSTQQLLEESYGLGSAFVIVFGFLAACVGLSSLINARLVMRLGMRRLVRIGGGSVAILSGVFLLASAVFAPGPDAHLPLWAFLIWAGPTFLSFGLVFGNLNALAMLPLGRLAGLGSAFVLTMSNIIAFTVATVIGLRFDGGPTAVMEGFLIANIAALVFGYLASGARSAALLANTPGSRP